MAIPVGQVITLNNSIPTGVAPGQSQYSAPAGSKAKIIGTRVVNGQTYYNIDQTAFGGGTGWTSATALEPAASVGSTPAPAATPSSTPQAPATNPVQAVNDTIQKTFQDLQSEVVSKFGAYQAGHPFSVDEVLADKTAQAKEQIDPYYNQLLGDYLQGVTTKINRGVDDTKALLDELNASTDSYTGSTKLALDKAVSTAQQGFADSGLFGSGTALNAEGQAKQAAGANLSDYTRKADYSANQATTGLARNTQDILSAKKDYVTNLEQNRLTDTSTRAAGLTKTAGQQYVAGFTASLPPEAQPAAGFDMLKSLGIYS